jgi:hypothetical protein
MRLRRFQTGRTRTFAVAFCLGAGLVLASGLAVPAPVRADALSFLRESPEKSGAVNPGELRKIGDALQGKVSVVDIINFGRLRFLSWPSRKRLSPAALDQFADFRPLRPPAALEGYQAPVVERVAPIKVQFALKVKSLNKLLASLGSQTLLPPELEGRSFTLSTTAELRVRYPSTDLKRRGDLLLSETRDPVLEVPAGVDLAQVREALLALPMWPEPLRRQFSWTSTGGTGGAMLQLDPVGEGDAEKVEVNGGAGLFVSFGPGPDRTNPQMVEFRRQMGREAEESGDPWTEHRMRGNTLLWHQNGLLLTLTGEQLSLAQAKLLTEAMR